MSYPPLDQTLVLGIGYKARQGKDYVAAHLVRTYGHYDVRRYGFADALRAVCRVQFGMTDKDAPLLQMVGTELYRRTDPDIWVRALYHTIREQAPRVAIITDVRFPNEAQFVTDVGGALIKVSRQHYDGSGFIAADRDPNHPSEIALDDFYGWRYTITAASGDFRALTEGAETVFEAAFARRFGHAPLKAAALPPEPVNDVAPAADPLVPAFDTAGSAGFDTATDLDVNDARPERDSAGYPARRAA